MQGHVIRLTGAWCGRKEEEGSVRVGLSGTSLSIGAPDVPPASWEDLKAAIADEHAVRIEKAVDEGRFNYLMVRYTRGGVGAAVVLAMGKDKSGAFALCGVRSASEAQATLRLRAGLHANSLANSRVAVVGVGAIGSFLCDLLSRSGVGHITAYDPDIVRPGNLDSPPRRRRLVGLTKPVAVKTVIEARAYSIDGR